jgi:signal transduction histidine kinase
MAMIKLNESRLAAVIEAQESERRRIARDLHDGVGQKLAGMRLLWEANIDNKSDNTAEQFSSIKKLMDQSVQEVRSISHQMMPKELEQFGLIAAIDQMLSEGVVKDTICWSFEHLNLTPRLDSAIELALFRITQELVSNIIKHANAKQVNVQLLKTNDHVVLMVSDDGKGMTPVSDKTRGIGMVNIESRATSLGGKVHVETALGKGTVTTIRIPL